MDKSPKPVTNVVKMLPITGKIEDIDHCGPKYIFMRLVNS